MVLLVTGAWKCLDEQLNSLRGLGHEIVFMQNEKDELPCAYERVEGVIGNGLFLYHDIRKFSSLTYIQLTSAGLDRVPLDYIQEKGIVLRNAKGVYSVPMAEFALCAVLQLYKQSRFFTEKQKSHTWEKHRGVLELFGKTVCVVGCGSVGTECAKRFAAFGCQVLGVDLYPREDRAYTEMVGLDGLDKQLAAADIVVLTLPLTAQTKGMMNAERFALMKQGSVLVNIARGGLVDEDALCVALDNRLLGAAVDVFETEPLNSESVLWEKENLIITPHNAFVGEGNNTRLWQVILEGLQGV
ncbi:MAG: hydroxyacid dehydrogenase [Clostridia bacterium]|nr:hydroxyacid dehydrogenase [Clostridia bacterium]